MMAAGGPVAVERIVILYDTATGDVKFDATLDSPLHVLGVLAVATVLVGRTIGAAAPDRLVVPVPPIPPFDGMRR